MFSGPLCVTRAVLKGSLEVLLPSPRWSGTTPHLVSWTRMLRVSLVNEWVGGAGKNIWCVHRFCHTAFTMTAEFLKKETGGQAQVASGRHPV